jgi:hypothetical protein
VTLKTSDLFSHVRAQHNNGMHPTRDTAALIYLQRLGRAGDAER